MKDISIKIRGILFFIILILIVIPIIQNKFDFIKLDSLNGAINPPEKKYFNLDDWFSGEYQAKEEKFINETFGFRSIFIRINNQIAFNLFNKASANGVIIGKSNYLYEENYIKAYFGTDFIGTDSITHRMQRLKFIQDTLNKLNKTLIVVFAAGKGSFFPEFFPSKYITTKGATNYENHLKLAKELGLNYIDFNSYFVAQKSTSKYPLYPKNGIHWSNYGMCLAADSLIKYIETKRKIDMPNIFWNEIEMTDAKGSDTDIGDAMNLLFKLKSEIMTYPKTQFQSDSGKIKPSFLVVADSYYWGIFNLGISNAFSKSHFWYYNKQIYPNSFQAPLETNQVNLKDEMDQHDVIVVMATEATLPNFGWGFIENVHDLFKGIERKTAFDAKFQLKVNNLRSYIKTDKKWMEQIAQKALNKKVSVDSMITLDAIWQVQHDKK